jgi:glycosyltransferase involved in cell wall biosynthesis
VPHKRIADGIKAVRRLVDEGIDVEYAVISDGPERPALESLRADLDLTDRVRLCGFLPRKKVVEELLHADILVHPSEAEGFGVAVTEGMAAGLPTVVARSGGVLDIVAHGRSGYLYEPGDLNSLVGHIASLAKNKDMRLAFGRVGREIAEAQFSWEHHMKEMCRAWQDALREPAGRHG